MTSSEDVMVSLSGIRSALNADGYDLMVAPGADDKYEIQITAGAEACAECLIPKSIMSDMIGAVAPSGVTWDLRYPTD
jgi:hypothetical protein